MARLKICAALALMADLALGATAATVEVKTGETHWSIAARELGNGHRWNEIADANQIAPPYSISPGQRLELPENALPRENPAEARPRESGRSDATPQKSTRPSEMTDEAPDAVEEEATPADAPALPQLAPYLAPLTGESTTFSLSLDHAVSVALSRNIGLQSGRLAPRTAHADLEVARSEFDPILAASIDQDWRRTRTNPASAVGTYSDARTTSWSAGVGQSLPVGTEYDVTVSGSRDRTSPTGSALNPSHDEELTLSVTQPLLDGFGRSSAYAGVDAAWERYEAAQQRSSRLTSTVRADIEAAYWNLATAQAAEQIARASLTLAEKLLVRNEKLLANELLAAVEVLTARAGVASRREALVAAITDRRKASETLLFSVYGEEALRQSLRPWAVTVPATAAEPEAENVLERQAIERREDLVAARKDLVAAGITLGSTRNALLPDLDLVGSVGTGGTAGSFSRAMDRALDNDEPSWSLGLALTFPIGNRGDEARYDAARIEKERRRLAYVDLENSIRLATRNARLDVVLGRERLAAAEESRELADARLRADRERLELGLTDTIRVLETEEDATSAYLAEARARYGLAAAAARLRAALGGAAP